MKEVILKIPENKFDFFMELVKQLGIKTADQDEEFETPEWHKELVLERMKNAKEKDFFPLEDLDNKIKL
ncbi:hypothetical protein ERX46_05875 [Brumimicrobium glaciale]|uniref:Uncharacterized protein n=1 Tax=Brumimicrobium glaciale TaxID=200475 RepID=A0A4Q4KN91_9FLAO|nr:hypothetical protein [Brumimicrobium glaciale]RYM34903.1 hypothetical protein ERX46_05875 [Brumimicrobium glaciale]